ncbi:hypothetical protein [Psychrobacter sp. L7]|uniref:hypothetical protein n=1 Tax=Psychrobacter sp. L7 TaxID=1982756 RepID=UPI001562493F|nr:hypothetical protein [Psychrobacter sp. L7]
MPFLSGTFIFFSKLKDGRRWTIPASYFVDKPIFNGLTSFNGLTGVGVFFEFGVMIH